MKLTFNVKNKCQPDPFLFEAEGKLYLYVTASKGVEAYSSGSLLGLWSYEGIVASFEGCHDYWAPSVTRIDDRYYLYVSCTKGECFQFMHAAVSDSPTGPFTNEVCLYPYFSIDSHTVETESGLFLFFAVRSENRRSGWQSHHRSPPEQGL